MSRTLARAPVAALLLSTLAFGASAASIHGQYIVIFKDHVANPHAEARGLALSHGGSVLHSYGAAVKGFSARLPDAAVQALRRNPNVESIEQDQTVQLSAVQTSPTWGLDRLDQRDVSRDSLYNYQYTGAGVTAFIIDTGIRADHVEFAGRIFPAEGYSAIADGNGTGDCNGHGTHVAGTVGGTSFGVAKQVSLVPVRVLDCAGSGSYSGVIAGIDFAANSPRRPAVANMSLGGTRSAAVNAAVAGAVAKGVNFVVAAGNDNVDACNASPASEPSAITVGATTSTDARASYSNWGTCLDVFAPGSSITSAWSTGSTATNTISGTSMATPHVTGIAALAAQANPGATPAAIAALVSGSATPNKISGAGTGSVNLLAYSLLGAASQTTVAVSSMAGAAQAVKRSWRAGVTVGIRNLATGAGVPGVTVTGSFAPGGGANCVTGSTGTCSLNSAIFADSTMVTVFTIGSAAGTNLVYDATQNTASQIRVYRP